jgi:hypothetical protein
MKDFKGQLWQHFLDEGEATFVEARDHGTERDADQAHRSYRARYVAFSAYMDDREKRQRRDR